MKEYIKPVIEITEFSNENIVTLSVGDGGLLEDIAGGRNDGMVTSVKSYKEIFSTTP